MTDSSKIFFNPNCSKCNLAKDLLSEKDIHVDVVEYLQSPPNKQELNKILIMLNLQPRQLMRTHEAAYSDNNLADESLTHDQLIEAMIKNPILIERPIVVHNGKAAIGRPPETILEIFQ